METALEDSRHVEGEGLVAAETDWVINPGIRAAFNFGGLQVVPGAAYTMGLGEGRGENSLFFYLSFEHPFRRQ
jgi:hypothetical protein